VEENMTTSVEKTNTLEKPAPDKRRALGRGLESLLPGPRAVASPPTAIATPTPTTEKPTPRAEGDEVREIALSLIDDNPHQTRYHFDQKSLQELAESITANGVVQPVVVRPAANGRFTLVLGERRCRASKLAGKEKIPAILRTVSEQQAAEMTVVENLQRHDLNCIEQANAFAKLSREFGLTQEQIGKRTGVSRESVSNYMRLLKLPEAVIKYLQEGSLGFSEARVLLTLLDASLIPKIADEAVKKHLSVQQLEDLVFATNVPMKKDGEAEHRARWVDPNVRAAQTELERVLGTRVRIRDRKGKGRIVIEYGTLEDFDRVLEILAGKSHA
jgi:ParB family transcriptional regulator, chromosome partitioning protein